MRDRLIELIAKSGLVLVDGGIHPDTHIAQEALADHLIAAGVIVPPCKVGDTVYRVSFVHKNVEMLNVDGFLCNAASWKAHCTRFLPTWLGNKKEHFYISFPQFGKTVFRSLDEAKKALSEVNK